MSALEALKLAKAGRIVRPVCITKGYAFSLVDKRVASCLGPNSKIRIDHLIHPDGSPVEWEQVPQPKE